MQQACPNPKLKSEVGYTSATSQNHPKTAKNKMADFRGHMTPEPSHMTQSEMSNKATNSS